MLVKFNLYIQKVSVLAVYSLSCLLLKQQCHPNKNGCCQVDSVEIFLEISTLATQKKSTIPLRLLFIQLASYVSHLYGDGFSQEQRSDSETRKSQSKVKYFNFHAYLYFVSISIHCFYSLHSLYFTLFTLFQSIHSISIHCFYSLYSLYTVSISIHC